MSRRIIAWAGAAAVWLVSLHIVAPWMIRLAYAERAPAWLNAVLAGRAVHPVEHYLGVWNAYAWKLDVLALVATGLFLARKPIARAWDRFVHAAPGVGPAALLGTALVFGLATGIPQGLHIFVRKTFQPLSQATLDQSWAALWMAPIGESAFILGIGLLLLLVTMAWRKPVSLRLVATIFAAVAVYGLLRSMRLGIGIWPNRLLALGIGVQAGVLVAARAGTFRRRIPTFVAAGVVWIVAMAALLYGGRALREWRVLRGLPEAGDDPDVVLLILDTVRAQSLGLYGHEHPTTPRLDALARESMVADGAVAVTSWTLPSHASMLTGHFPWEMTLSWTVPMGNEFPTLPEVLSRRGYATGGFVSNMFFAGRAAGMARGFGHFVDAPVSLDMVISNSWVLNRTAVRVRRRLDMYGSVTRDARNISDRFLDWSARQDRPYFAMLNYMDAHAPYESPDSILRRFADERPINNLTPGKVYTPEQIEDLHESYDAAIAYIDQEIGRIVDALRARGELDNTILIVTSDHGEQLGERQPGLHGHANSLYATSIVVPLLIRYPAGVPAGVRLGRTVGTGRIPATVMDLVGGEPVFPGGSIVAELGVPASEPDESPALSFLLPNVVTRDDEPLAAGPMASGTWRQWHYIRNGDGVEELYDFVADPWELENRAGEPDLRPLLERLRPAAGVLEPFGAPPPALTATGDSGDQRAPPVAGAASRRETAPRSAGSA